MNVLSSLNSPQYMRYHEYDRVCLVYNITKLPLNLRPTTSECVHIVTRGHVTKMAVTLFD